MKFTREKADALCTVITFGFFQTEGNQIIIQTEPAKGNALNQINAAIKEAVEYDTINNLYQIHTGIALQIDQSPKQEHMPYILAKRPGDMDGVNAQVDLTNVTPVIQALFQNAEHLGNDAPWGAYIGGKYDSASHTLTIFGPSAMSQYLPRYRGGNLYAPQIQEAFNRVTQSSLKSWKCIIKLLDYQAGSFNPLNIEMAPVNEAFDNNVPSYINGRLFKSEHGMIQAMIDSPNDLIFEIALGQNTSKVGSCVPCSLFMFANGRPPSSIHLGRGDNWGLPTACPQVLRDNWIDKINIYYNTGIAIFNAQPVMSDNIRSLEAYLDTLQNNFSIPELFLEALSFESKFTEKIINTLMD
ncbi:MAG: hypothetical protein LBD76_07360 [Prevotellaceae bacterium]|jgi:hypothetical protein|nr:hypothetical protein [Prevotellaceae bacterium]